MIPRLLPTLLLAVLACPAFAESFEEVQAKTDMSNADAVFQLAQWCMENKQPSKGRQLYAQVLKIDKDHEGARNALGQVRVGDRWVARNLAPAAATAPPEGSAAAGTAPRPASGPGPAAKDVPWDLTIPKDPAAGIENTFLDGYVAQMKTSRNDSDAMGNAVATLMMKENWPSALPRICQALLAPDFDDVYGAAEICLQLRREKRFAEAQRLLGFLVRGSEKATDPEDLSYMCLALVGSRERKAVPRLVELLANPSKDVVDAAKEALASITNVPVKSIEAGRMKSWWDANWSVSEEQILAEQLNGSDLAVAVEAAAALCERRDKAIFPVLIRLLRSGDKGVVRRAIQVVKRATGLDWSMDITLPPEEMAKRVERLEKWWKEEQLRFAWPGLPAEGTTAASAPAPERDPDAEQVEQLASTAGTSAQAAEAQLLSRGTAAVRALIGGLSHASPIARRRAHDILRQITKQDIPYDPRAEEPQRTAAIDAWKAWAVQQKLMPSDDPAPSDQGESTGAEPPPGPAQPPAPKRP